MGGHSNFIKIGSGNIPPPVVNPVPVNVHGSRLPQELVRRLKNRNMES